MRIKSVTHKCITRPGVSLIHLLYLRKMNKALTITAMLTTPTSVLASGSEVLSLLWLSLLVFIIVVVSLYLAKITSKQKLFVFLVYLTATIIGYVATSGVT